MPQEDPRAGSGLPLGCSLADARGWLGTRETSMVIRLTFFNHQSYQVSSPVTGLQRVPSSTGETPGPPISPVSSHLSHCPAALTYPCVLTPVAALLK